MFLSKSQKRRLRRCKLEGCLPDWYKWLYKCIGHVQFVVKAQNLPREIPWSAIEELQDHPQMYFRKSFIAYAIQKKLEPCLELVTKEECVERCTKLIQCVLKNKQYPECNRDYLTKYFIDYLTKRFIVPNFLMIYRKKIIREALQRN